MNAINFKLEGPKNIHVCFVYFFLKNSLFKFILRFNLKKDINIKKLLKFNRPFYEFLSLLKGVNCKIKMGPLK